MLLLGSGLECLCPEGVLLLLIIHEEPNEGGVDK